MPTSAGVWGLCSETETLHKVAHILTTKDKPADCTDDPFLVEKMCAELEGRCIVVQRCRCLCMSKPPETVVIGTCAAIRMLAFEWRRL